MSRRLLISLIALFFSCAVESPAAPSFTELPSPDGVDYPTSTHLSPDGTTVGAALYNSTSGQVDAVSWTSAGGTVDIGNLGGEFGSDIFGFSSNNSVAVGQSDNGAGFQPFRYTSAGGMVALGVPSGMVEGAAQGVSADGTVVVGSADDEMGNGLAFRWTSGTGTTSLGTLSGDLNSGASGISANGQVIVGGSSSDTTSQAFRWTSSGGMVGLGQLPGGQGSFAQAVSANGSVIVGGGQNASGNNEAFRWTSAGGMVGLGALDTVNFYSQANAVTPDGAIVVGTSLVGTSGEGQVFIWDATNGMRNLQTLLETTYGIDLTGWQLSDGEGVSYLADGEIAISGIGTDPSGNFDVAWYAVIPEPSTYFLLLLAVPFLFLARRRRLIH